MIELTFNTKPTSPPVVALLTEEVAPGVMRSSSGSGTTCLEAIHAAYSRLLTSRPHIQRAAYWRLKRRTMLAAKQLHTQQVQRRMLAQRAAA